MGKLLLITGLYSKWNKKTWSFTPTSADNIAKNKILQQERTKYLKIAERELRLILHTSRGMLYTIR